MDVPTLRTKYFDNLGVYDVKERVFGILKNFLKRHSETTVLTWLIQQLKDKSGDKLFQDMLSGNLTKCGERLRLARINARDSLLEREDRLELAGTTLSKKDQHPLLTVEYMEKREGLYLSNIQQLWDSWIRDGQQLNYPKNMWIKKFIAEANKLNLSEKIVESILEDDLEKARQQVDRAHQMVIESDKDYQEFKDSENSFKSEIQALKLSDIELDPKEEINVEKLITEIEEKKKKIEKILQLIAKNKRRPELDLIQFEPEYHDEVLFLIGILVAQGDLPLRILDIQQGFPDITALYYSNDEWQERNIEVELVSGDFRQHMKDGRNIKECDMIICWRDNWPEEGADFPEHIEVIELQEFVKNLPR